MTQNASPSPDAGHPVVAALLDAAMWSLRKIRRRVIPRARGRVLEIGVGTGGNLPLYREVDSVAGIDPDPYMLRRARRRAEKTEFPVELHELGAESLPFADDSFDTVVATWVLCTIPDPEAAAREMRRVLKPGGTLIFAEHTISRYPTEARLQRRLTPVWARCAAGCHLDRDSITLLRDAGFRDIELRPGRRERFTLLPVYYGTARG